MSPQLRTAGAGLGLKIAAFYVIEIPIVQRKRDPCLDLSGGFHLAYI